MASWRSTRSVEIRTAFFYLWNFPKKPLMAGVNALASDILYIGYLYILNIPVWMDCRSTTEREKWRSRICNVPRFTAEFPCPFPPFFIPNRRWSFPPTVRKNSPSARYFACGATLFRKRPFRAYSRSWCLRLWKKYFKISMNGFFETKNIFWEAVLTDDFVRVIINSKKILTIF